MMFTDKSIKSLKAKDKHYVVTENIVTRGEGRLQLRVLKSGAKSWRVLYYFNKAPKTLTIGSYPSMSLKEAREEHSKIAAQLRNKKDPKAVIEIEKTEHEQKSSLRTFQQLLIDFDVYIENKWAESTIRRTKLLIARNITKFIDPQLLACQFTVDDARELIYRVYNRGAHEQARLTRSTLMSILKFAIDFDNSPERFKKHNIYDIKSNFIRDINVEVTKNKGQRWLTEDEIRRVWFANDLPYMTQKYLQLAICLAGQRVEEVYKSIESEYDFDEMVFTIPVDRVKIKSRGDHLVPIEPLTETIVKELLLQRGSKNQLFPHRDRNDDFAHISTLRMATLRWCDKHNIPRFAPRDIRRTCKTLMGKAGISKENRDYLQQHNQSDVSSLHYDRYDYMREKREAMAKWHCYLKTILKL
ncbi:site-specific integrase [Pseudoalteromonas luteoviolacea]|uniref:tyrosine-type recombinase/integrase n=1 Tax=Pseudoalteromonas luteoviolacea TaxID=43657 RepID=UPI001F415B90|nr:site-specific integrase [Pseudoalteromonas luteoviolacea]MCF6442853.1 site-specific integrase [Pseudoalteromonas luteoviolacea]